MYDIRLLELESVKFDIAASTRDRTLFFFGIKGIIGYAINPVYIHAMFEEDWV